LTSELTGDRQQRYNNNELMTYFYLFELYIHMPNELRQQALNFLRIALNNPVAEFREGQWEAIETLVENQARLLVVQRTGWGKSLVYFLATRLLRDRGNGPTLLISPLLALMRNQIAAASRINIKAATINSSNTEEWESVTTELLTGNILTNIASRSAVLFNF